MFVLVLVLGLSIGIIAGGLGLPWSLGLILIGGGSIICCLRRQKWLLLLPGLGLGLLLVSVRMAQLPPVEEAYGQQQTMVVQYRGTLSSTEDSTLWRGRVSEPQHLAGAKVRVRSKETPAPGYYLVSGRLQPPISYLNPDRAWHYQRQLLTGEQAYIYQDKLILIAREKHTILEQTRYRFRQNILAAFDEISAPLALAVSLGDRSYLDQEERSNLTKSGAGHIIALSGLHVSILAGALLFGLKRFIRQRLVAEILVILGLLLFVALAGPSPSLIRAVLMTLLGLAGFLATGRTVSGLSALGAAAFLMLCYNALWLYDYAFILSFCASAAGLIGGRKLADRLGWLPEGARRTAGYSLAIQGGLLPLQALIFGGISVWSVIVNILILPILPVVLVLILLVGALGPTAAALAAIAGTILAGISEGIRIFASAPGWLHLPASLVLPLSAIAGLFALILAGAGRKPMIALLCAFLVFCGYGFVQRNILWTVWILDVGQGDSILVRNRQGWMLIDCGDARAGEFGVVPALRYLGANNLTVVITHPHSDHVGGLDAISRNFKVDRLYINSAHRQNYPVPDNNLLTVNQPLSLIQGNKVWSPAHLTGRTLSTNDQSLVLSLNIRGFETILAGDLEEEGELLLLFQMIRHRLLKVGHHGSKTSTGALWLDRIAPEVAVISVGRNNQHGFPNPEVLAALEEAEVYVFRTDRHGCVKITVWPGVACRVTSVAGGAKWQKIILFSESSLSWWTAALKR